jgi:hypothetical protein
VAGVGSGVSGEKEIFNTFYVRFISAQPVREALARIQQLQFGHDGSVYEYHRNDNFDARNFFDPAGKELPEYKRNQFGGSLGFSVTSSLKLFGTYDGLRIHKSSTLLMQEIT